MADLVMGCAEVIVVNPSLKVTVSKPVNQTHIIFPVAGPAGPATTIVADQSPAETPDGINSIFTTPFAYVADSLMVFLNGLQEHNIIQLTPTTFQFTTPPEPGDTVRLTFAKI